MTVRCDNNTDLREDCRLLTIERRADRPMETCQCTREDVNEGGVSYYGRGVLGDVWVVVVVIGNGGDCEAAGGVIVRSFREMIVDAAKKKERKN